MATTATRQPAPHGARAPRTRGRHRAALAPGGTRALWLLNYDEFFSYNAEQLTFSRYLAWGLGNIIGSKVNALGFILLVVLFGVWQIFLTPFAAIGFWIMRRRVELQAALIYLVFAIADGVVYSPRKEKLTALWWNVVRCGDTLERRRWVQRRRVVRDRELWSMFTTGTRGPGYFREGWS